MNTRRYLAAAAVAVTAVALPGAAADGAADRPNSRTGARATASVANAAWVRERIGSPSDEDWYRFDVATAGKVQVVLGGLPQDYTLEVYDDAGHRLGRSVHSGTQFERVVVDAAAGPLYARVDSAAGGYDAARDYAVQFRTLPRRLIVMSAFATKRADGYLTFVIDMYNNTGGWVRVPGVQVELLDAANRVIRRDGVAITIMDVPSGGSSKIVDTFVKAPPGYAKSRVIPEWYAGPAFTRAKLAVRGVKVSTAASGARTYTGTVSTTSTTLLDNAVVDVSHYDQYGRLRGQAYYLVDPVVSGAPKRFTAPMNQWTTKPNRAVVSVIQQFFEP